MELFHVLNRGVDKRNIVLNDGDRVRFVHSLYIFNNRKPAPNYAVYKRYASSGEEDHFTREPLVHIHAWCLMDNHYHLLLSPVEDDVTNMSKFMKKLNTGYAKYFNEKYDRGGYLWQGKYKKIHVRQDAHFMYIPYYIHLNPLDYRYPKWRLGQVPSASRAIKSLHKYRWSSHLDYTGEKNFPSLIDKRVLQPVLGTRNTQEKEMAGIISDFERAQEANFIE